MKKQEESCAIRRNALIVRDDVREKETKLHVLRLYAQIHTLVLCMQLRGICMGHRHVAHSAFHMTH